MLRGKLIATAIRGDKHLEIERMVHPETGESFFISIQIGRACLETIEISKKDLLDLLEACKLWN